MGIELDDILNSTASPRQGEVADITSENSRVRILVIPTDEERMIACETIGTLGKRNVADIIKNKQEKNVSIEVSAHHVHLCRRDIEVIFGEKYELTRWSDLSQPGQFACEEAVDLVGPKGKVERVRVLGPLRNQTQVEISMTEEYRLGIKAPIRASGDLEGSPGLIIEGTEGTCGIHQGVICALRHIHMSPEDALSFGLRDRDVVMVQIKGDRTLTFGDVLVRVDPDFRLSMHIDTDEANAAGIRTGFVGHIVGIQERR
jgi:acetate kinase